MSLRITELASPSPHLWMETDPVSETLCFLVFRILDFAYHPEFYILEKTAFQKLGLFPSSGDGRETLCWVL
jgi:hypothetical protein